MSAAALRKASAALFFAGVMAVIENGKITYADEKKTIKIVADAGGSLRAEELTNSFKKPRVI